MRDRLVGAASAALTILLAPALLLLAAALAFAERAPHPGPYSRKDS